MGANGRDLWKEVGLYMSETGFQSTRSRQYPCESVCVGLLHLWEQNFPTVCPQIQHIRHERTWSKLSEAEKWRDEGSEDESFVDTFVIPC